MSARSLLALLAAGLALLSPFAGAATSVQLLTPQAVSVAGGESQVFSVRFFDALGQPAVGETATFTNDACGFFPNGAFGIAVTTDVTGVASTTFTAMNPAGITCVLSASAGVSARFDVHTYQPALTYFSIATNPPIPRPAQPYTLLVSLMTGAYKLFNVDIAARIVPGTVSAAIAPGSTSSGQSGTAEFSVTPDNRLGNYEIEVQFRNKTQRVPMLSPANPWKDMWWSGRAQNGWGMSVVQHGDMLFSVIYAYDAAGKPTWYVIPGGTWKDAHTAFTGALYVPRGSPYSAYDTTKFEPGAPVGNATLTFTGVNDATLDYTINGVSERRILTRQEFGPMDRNIVSDHADMWWGGPSQNGWGLAVLQQYSTLFCVWFTYDTTGAPTWLVMPAGFWSDANTYAGHIYRTTGSPWLGRPYDVNALQVIDVGTFRIRFTIEGATFEYTIEGRSGSMPLTRQSF